MDRFHAPAAFAELDRQPIEQRAVDGILALHAEVLGGFDDARAEEMLPDAIDLHARGQRMLGGHQPAGEAEPILRRILRQRRQKCGRGERDLFPGLEIFAAFEDLRLDAASHRS